MPKLTVVSEGPVKITKQTIEAVGRRRAPATRIVVRDLACRGLSLVANPTSIVWRFEYKARGVDPTTGRRWPSQAITIGTPESHTPEEAREEVGRLKAQTKAGEDPASKRKAAIAEASRQRASTMERLIVDYARALPKRPKLRGAGTLSAASVAQDIALLTRATKVMAVGSVPVASVTVDDLHRLLSADVDRPATARKQFGALSRFFDWAQSERHVRVNPCIMLGRARRPKAVPPRPNFLHLDQLAQLWKAADQLHAMEKLLVRFLISVPCRLREATQLEWAHIDTIRSTWTVPGALSKNREPHRIHLHPIAMEIVRSAGATRDAKLEGLVFPSPRAGRPIETFTRIKSILSDATGLADWTFHDFRRSFASACAEHGVAEAVADAVLSHRQSATRGGVLGVYQRATRWPEQVAAMNTWGQLLDLELNGPAAPTVLVPFSAGRRELVKGG